MTDVECQGTAQVTGLERSAGAILDDEGAAQLLGVSERQEWRLLVAYRKEGAGGLVH